MKKIAFCSLVLLFCISSIQAQVNCSGYFIRFPDDHPKTPVCNYPGFPDSIFGQPEILGNSCDSIHIEYQDFPEDFNPSQIGECYEFERRWTIYNPATYDPTKLCNYVPNPAPSNTSMAAINALGPVVSAPGAVIPGWEPTNVKLYPNEPNPTNFSTYWSETANCYFYVQKFRIFDNNDPIVSSTSTDTILFDDTPNDAYLWNNPAWTDPETGDHNLRESQMDFEITAMDSCTNINPYDLGYRLFLDVDNDGVEETVIWSIDPPAPGTIHLGNYPTSNNGIVREFDSRPVPANEKWKFGYQITSTWGNPFKVRIIWKNAVGQTVPVQLPRGRHRIQWFVSDNCGNSKMYSFPLANTAPNADSLFSVSGRVVNHCGEGMSDVVVSAGSYSTLTDDNGTYTIDNVSINTNLTVCATEFNSITTFADQVNVCDVRRVTLHILGLEPLTTPFQLIAADANYSGTVTTHDVVKIRNMLMGLVDLEIVPPPPFNIWRHFNSVEVFSNPGNPFGIVKACYDIPQIQQSVVNIDFRGLKSGDADESAGDCGFTGAPVPMFFNIPDLHFNAGDTISFSVSPVLPVDVYQFVLKAKGLQFWRPDPANNLSDQVYISDSVALIANIGPAIAPQLYLIAQESGSLAAHLEVIDDIYLRPSAYLDSCMAIEPSLLFLPVSTRERANTLTMRHFPNPWRSQTTIELQSPASSDGLLEVTDVTGRVIYAAPVQLQKGMNRFNLREGDFTGSGLLFCKIVTPEVVFAGRCLKME